jgi:gluconate 2-dehydrogenase gamma chain
MDGPLPTRREFVSSGAGTLGAGWLWLQLPMLAALSACARDAARSNEPFTTLSAAEGLAMSAFAARIIPSDPGSPGAAEAGAAWFADAVLGGPFDEMAGPVRAGLADLDARARASHAAAFAQLDAAQQDAIIGAVVDTPFFELGRMLVVMGTLCDPSRGGNRGHVGFTLIGMEHASAFTPPFGWYDAEHARTNGGAA